MKVTYKVIADYLQISNVKTTFIALSSTLVFVSIASLVYLQNLQGIIAAIVMLVIAAINYRSSLALKTDINLLLESDFDLSLDDLIVFRQRKKTSRIINIVLLLVAIISLLIGIILPLYFIFAQAYDYKIVAIFFAFLAISIHIYLFVKNSNDNFSKLANKIDSIY